MNIGASPAFAGPAKTSVAAVKSDQGFGRGGDCPAGAGGAGF
jgi:hypothetical protein